MKSSNKTLAAVLAAVITIPAYAEVEIGQFVDCA